MTQLILKSPNNQKLFPLINDALKNESLKLRLGIERIQTELKKYEKEFNLNSETFYKQYQKGKMGDSSEIIDWAGKFELLLDIKEEYQSLQEIEVCT
ncbi:hypothetical protein KKH56_08470 [bacterium]|nr:hypothetical protein [bacterium]